MKILYYTNFFGLPLSQAEGFNPALLADRGQVLTDPQRLNEADAVVFHLPNLTAQALPEKQAGQIWVGLSVEANAHYPWQTDDGFMRQFDLKMLVKRDSDIPLTYLRPEMIPSFRTVPRSKFGRTPAVSFHSNEQTPNGRSEVLAELQKGLSIHLYGRGEGARKIRRDRGRETRLRRISAYSFYLAFENCNEIDYVSEKIYDAFVAGTVPVYLGAPNVTDFLPAKKCAIFVRDFASATELTEYLLELHHDRRRYREYLEWRQQPFLDSFRRLAEQNSLPSLVRLYLKLKAMRRTDPHPHLSRQK